MKTNKMLIIITASVFLVVGMMLFVLFSGNSSSTESNKTQDVLDLSLNDLTPEELRSMGIEGDTAQDTVRTLIGTVKSNQKRVEQVISQNEKLSRENQQLRNQDSNVEYRVSEAVRIETQDLLTQVDQLKKQVIDLSQTASTPLPSISGTQTGGSDMPVGLGLDGEHLPGTTPSQGMRWVEPDDQIGLDSNGKRILDSALPTKVGFPSDFKSGQSTSQRNTQDSKDDNLVNDVNRVIGKITKPFYTVPENSTLLGSVAMTALIGRVPIDNNVTDPYPFKILIGRENLIANGIELPDIEGAIASGTATGDWTLSCVRGEIKSLTFVFSDGRIVTSSQTSNSGSNSGNKIGWLSDDHGLPCIPGDRKTNAPEYLGTNFLLAGASAAAQGFSQAQTTTVVDGSSVVGAVTGDQGKFILGQALGSGLKETSDWFRARYGQMFDAVYVPPGHPVAIHIERAIEIDYNALGRKVKYNQPHTTRELD
ncbi:integrating conjugative element protein, PFL_4705 family [Pasteurella testudinis DSM 23072]|uniref:Integrating conjugative element protein, PFL_4705 family n=1 Tax=Pasteurella testudinis DSM 23072 TaxID=1122938 RepID=A0A1W1UVW4_9PAST|nr:TIGR03752 family integrating conjugative element protein [Pasteurella testudinis]SMB85190.1 integrating conjugative element protein, PFL_4705 family [Pasteurella testudinis DSM 23072]SUB52131.1 integrating conjugative element protein, PFL family [Pasteurella testudinis]